MSDLDIEAKERNEHLLAQARLQMQEQEDEIKRLNEMILQAKIYAIRDAQLQEKQQIEQEVKHEDRRLDEVCACVVCLCGVLVLPISWQE